MTQNIYGYLYGLLEEAQWRDADVETYRLMLEMSDRTQESWLRQEDILSFPCEELRTLDELWVYHSQGKFGFSVQKSIYDQLRLTYAEEEEIWQKLGNQIGWYVNDQWLTYPELTFHLAAPFGHLPRYVSLHIGSSSPNHQDFWGKYLFSRLDSCHTYSEETSEDWIDELEITDEEE